MNKTLRILREENRLSQASVAEYLGISRQMYMKYESGETEPGVKSISLLCKLYKVDYDVIIDDKYCTSKTSMKICEPSVAYTVDTNQNKSTFGMLFLNKIDSLTSEQKYILGSLINSFVESNKLIRNEKDIGRRKPGAYKGEFKMSEDFDDTPDCFKEYM